MCEEPDDVHTRLAEEVREEWLDENNNPVADPDESVEDSEVPLVTARKAVATFYKALNYAF